MTKCVTLAYLLHKARNVTHQDLCFLVWGCIGRHQQKLLGIPAEFHDHSPQKFDPPLSGHRTILIRHYSPCWSHGHCPWSCSHCGACVLRHITQHSYAMMQWRKGKKSLPMKWYIIVCDLHASEGRSGQGISPNAADTPLFPHFPPPMVPVGLTLLLKRT